MIEERILTGVNGKVISLQFITKYQYLYIDDFVIKNSQSDLIECEFINNEVPVVNAYIFVPINVKINSFFTKWNKHAHIQ